MRTLTWVALAGLVTACGGSGGGGGSNGDTTAPVIEICFPGTFALTDAATIVVRGRAIDTGGVTAVTVNGAPVTTTDNFANWTITVALVAGANVLPVSATDTAGNVNPMAATVTVTQTPAATTTATTGAGLGFAELRDIDLDLDRTRLLVLDGRNAGEGALMAVDLATGDRTVISQAGGPGSGASMLSPVRMVAHIPGSSVFVTEDSANTIVQVNFITGARAVVSDSAMGTGPTFPDPRGIGFANNTMYWIDSAASRLISAATFSGNTRTAVTDNAIDATPSMTMPEDVAVNPSGAVAYVLNSATPDLQSVNTTNGQRDTIASAAMGTGAFNAPLGLALDIAGNRVATTVANGVVFVDLATGNRTPVTTVGTLGNGPVFSNQQALAVDPNKNVIYVTDQNFDAVYIVDVVSGDRAIFSKG